MTDPQQPQLPENTLAAENPQDAESPATEAQPAPAAGPAQASAEEPTRTLPPFFPPPADPAPAPVASASPRRTGGLVAAVLAGSLLVGGAAGIGGAAWYDAWQGDDPATTTGSEAGPVTASNAAALPDGTVEKVANAVLPSVVKINVSGRSGSGSGSGIVLSEDGNILTNNHVVTAAGGDGDITVNFNDGTTVRAKVVGTDPVTDVAVIKAEDVDDLTPATIGKSGSLRVGQEVVAVGSPYGLNATVTSGIVSALDRPVSVEQEERTPQFPQFPFGQEQQEPDPAQANLSTTYPAIQTDAAINPGNSGGPLVDLAGRVVGINSSIRTAGSSITGTGGSIGLGFAIPIDEVLPIVNQILDGETPTHARMAVTVSNVTTDTLAQGALIRSVQEGGPADKAGLEEGDVITKVDDQVIDGSESLVATIRGHRPGDEVTFTYLRDGKSATAKATLGSDADATDTAHTEES